MRRGVDIRHTLKHRQGPRWAINKENKETKKKEGREPLHKNHSWSIHMEKKQNQYKKP